MKPEEFELERMRSKIGLVTAYSVKKSFVSYNNKVDCADSFSSSDIQSDSFESQLDDFKIQNDDGSYEAPEDSQSNLSDEKDDSQLSSKQSEKSTDEKLPNFDEQENEQYQKIDNYLKHYYDKNFFRYKIFSKKDYISERVWNVHYNANSDTVYLFIARLKVKHQRESAEEV